MSFIGIIAKSKNGNNIKQILKQKLQKQTVICLNEESIENLKNIKFETIIIMDNVASILSKKELLKCVTEKARYVIVNADENTILELMENMNLNIITYGFNRKSTISASSVKDDNILLYIQRNIEDINKNELEVQEISISKTNNKLSTNIIMGISTILLLYGIQNVKI